MRRPPGDLAAAGALMLLVAALWLAVRVGWVLTLDTAGLLAVADALPPAAAAILTRPGDTLVRLAVGGVVAATLWLLGNTRAARFLLVAVGGGAIFNETLKQLAGRARPDLLPTIEQAHGTSFPSGHAAGAVVLFGAFALLVPGRWRPLALLVAVLAAAAIGASRIALAVHWPSDVIAGWAAGAAWLIVVQRALMAD